MTCGTGVPPPSPDVIGFEEMAKPDYMHVTTWSRWRDVCLRLRTLPVVAAARGGSY